MVQQLNLVPVVLVSEFSLVRALKQWSTKPVKSLEDQLESTPSGQAGKFSVEKLGSLLLGLWSSENVVDYSK